MMSRPAWVILAAGLWLGCAAPKLPFMPVTDVKRLMQAVIDPAADHLWDAVGSVSDSNGTVEFAPTSPEEWDAVRNSAYIVAESGNLLMMEGRARDRGEWMTLSRAMIEAGRQAALAAEKRDKDAVFEAGGVVYEACSKCHAAYLIPLAPPGGKPK